MSIDIKKVIDKKYQLAPYVIGNMPCLWRRNRMIDEKKLIKDLEETVRVSVKAGDCTARKLLGLFMVVITNQPKVDEWITWRLFPEPWEGNQTE